MIRVYDLESDQFWDVEEEDPRRALVLKAIEHYGETDTMENKNHITRSILRGQHGLSYRDLCVAHTSADDRKH
ncbi:hypothetical protein [Salinicola avicenniae]|uniref:hypothetical protein n=1 Tax=Salinicola avicenniae TaxID=2916836 RepID=UPI00207332AB|nr:MULTISPECIES: hypothetical protein [unclassified Salinicola]